MLPTDLFSWVNKPTKNNSLNEDEKIYEELDDIEDEIIKTEKQKNILEKRLNVLNKEVSTTKKLFKYYKEKKINISYNDTKLVIKRNKLLIEYEIYKLDMELKKLEEERNQKNIDVSFLQFLNLEINGDLQEEPKVEKISGSDFPTALQYASIEEAYLTLDCTKKTPIFKIIGLEGYIQKRNNKEEKEDKEIDNILEELEEKQDKDTVDFSDEETSDEETLDEEDKNFLNMMNEIKQCV